jgi:hypothetical protein
VSMFGGDSKTGDPDASVLDKLSDRGSKKFSDASRSHIAAS